MDLTNQEIQYNVPIYRTRTRNSMGKGKLDRSRIISWVPNFESMSKINH